METTQQEDAIQLLNSVLLVGVMIITTVVYTYVQDQLHGILLETIRQGYAPFSVLKDFTLTLLPELVSVSLSVLALTIFTETKQGFMILSEMLKLTDARLFA